MLFVRHASTPGMRTACFPAPEQADRSSLARAARLAGTADLVRPAAYVSPVPAALQTATAMGLAPIVVNALAETDHGRWNGLPYAQVAQEEPESLASWLADPQAAPHGGESLTAMTARVTSWLDGVLAGGVDERAGFDLVICDAGVIRAAIGHALGIAPAAAARFDLAPLSTTELVASRGGWRVAHVNRVAHANVASHAHRKVTS